MQANRMRRMLQTTLPRMKPHSVRDGFCWQKNNETKVVASNVHYQLQHCCSTMVGGKSVDKILVRKSRLDKLAEEYNLDKWQHFGFQVQERTLNIITDGKKAKGLYVSPSLADNIKQIFDFFPFSPEVPWVSSPTFYQTFDRW